MARPTLAQAARMSVKSLLAIAVSGKNPDGTDNTFGNPTGGGGSSDLQVGGSAVSSSNPVPVDPGQAVVSAAANAVGSSKHKLSYGSVALALTGSQVKNGAGVIYGYHIANEHATTAIYVNFYDSSGAPASPTGNSEAPLKIPGGAALDVPGIVPPIGDWSAGIWVTFSANPDGTGNPAAVPTGFILYK